MILGSPISGSQNFLWNHHPKAGPSASSNGFVSVQRLQSTHWPCEPSRLERLAQRSGGRCSWDRNSLILRAWDFWRVGFGMVWKSLIVCSFEEFGRVQARLCFLRAKTCSTKYQNMMHVKLELIQQAKKSQVWSFEFKPGFNRRLHNSHHVIYRSPSQARYQLPLHAMGYGCGWSWFTMVLLYPVNLTIRKWPSHVRFDMISKIRQLHWLQDIARIP